MISFTIYFQGIYFYKLTNIFQSDNSKPVFFLQQSDTSILLVKKLNKNDWKEFFNFQVFVHEAEGLPGGDLPDPPDPYVKVVIHIYNNK